jgi:hypothetical protein
MKATIQFKIDIPNEFCAADQSQIKMMIFEDLVKTPNLFHLMEAIDAVADTNLSQSVRMQSIQHHRCWAEITNPTNMQYSITFEPETVHNES